MTRKKREGRFSSWYLLFLPLIDQEHKPLTKTWHSLCKNIRIYVWITVRWPNDPANRSFLVTRREDDFAKFISRGCRCKTNYLHVPSFSHFFRQSPESRDNPSIASKPIRSVGQAPLVSRLAHRRYQLQLKATWPASQPAKLKENEPDGFYDLLRKGWTLVQGKLCSFCERQKGRDTEGYMYWCSCVSRMESSGWWYETTSRPSATKRSRLRRLDDRTMMKRFNCSRSDEFFRQLNYIGKILSKKRIVEDASLRTWTESKNQSARHYSSCARNTFKYLIRFNYLILFLLWFIL